MIRIILLGLSAALAAGLLFVNLYTSIVDAPNWGADLPNSINTARVYYSDANPGTFFRIFSPLNQAFAIIALVIAWKHLRSVAVAALITAILLDVFTFGYFYPRNEIMFISPIDENAVKNAWQEWSTMNWFRSGLSLLNTVLSFIVLLTVSKKSL